MGIVRRCGRRRHDVPRGSQHWLFRIDPSVLELRDPPAMPSMTISTPHSLGAEEATARLKTFFAKLKERHQDKLSNLEEQWNGNRLDYSFSTYGFNIKGDLTIEPGEVKVSGNLPFAAMMFKGKIEQTVREELEKVLA
jgi:hypothetical protein